MELSQKGPENFTEYGYSIINSNLKTEFNEFEKLLVRILILH